MALSILLAKVRWLLLARATGSDASTLRACTRRRKQTVKTDNHKTWSASGQGNPRQSASLSRSGSDVQQQRFVASLNLDFGRLANLQGLDCVGVVIDILYFAAS